MKLELDFFMLSAPLLRFRCSLFYPHILILNDEISISQEITIWLDFNSESEGNDQGCRQQRDFLNNANLESERRFTAPAINRDESIYRREASFSSP